MQTDYCYFGLRLLADLDITLRSESVLLMEIEFVGVHYPPNLVVHLYGSWDASVQVG